jgi:predicted O-methyltransferase YrrM
MGLRHLSLETKRVSRWLYSSKEHTNFTYDLTDCNVTQLTWFVSLVANKPVSEVRSLVRELEDDRTLRQTIACGVAASRRKGLADTEAHYGRRLAWYCLIRLLEPQLVVETGTDKGLGSLVMAAALLRNGHGRLVTIDINPASGYLITGPYGAVVDRVIGDSLMSIAAIDDPIDMFLHDSDHSAEHELAELNLVGGRLSERAVVLSDNAHATSCLADWAETESMRFLFFAEEPVDHWFRGAGVGCAFR